MPFICFANGSVKIECAGRAAVIANGKESPNTAVIEELKPGDVMFELRSVVISRLGQRQG